MINVSTVWSIFVFSAVYWIFDTILDVYIFRTTDFFTSLLIPDQTRLTQRLLTLLLITLYAVITQWTLIKRKQAERRQSLIAEIMTIINNSPLLVDTINRILISIKREMGFDAVGIRLRSGDDFPYFVQNGFSDDFLRTENTLTVRDQVGDICRDENGDISLGCACGLVISGRTDPKSPLFTQGGSFWINDSLPLLGLTVDQDPRLYPRNRCIHEGFRSVALIPIRANQRIVGLLQLNDRKKGCFTLDMIHYFEGLGSSIGIALSRKQMEEALIEKTTMLDNILRSANDMAIATTDLDFRITYYNSAAEKLFGYSAKQVIGKTVQEMHTREKVAPERFVDAIEQVRNKGEYRYFIEQKTDNGIRHIGSRVSGIISPAGDIVGYSLFSQDITGRMAAEQALIESAQRLKMVTDNVPAVIGYVDKNYRYQFVNKNYEKWFGLKQEEMLGMTVKDLLPNGTYELSLPFIKRALSGEEVTFEETLTLPDGTTIAFCNNLVPDRSSNDEIKGYYVLVSDITERKRAEEALRESELRYRTVADFTFDWEYWMSPDQSFIYCSPACERITGYQAEEFEKSPDLLAAITHPDDREQISRHIDDVNSPGPELHEQEFRIISRSGEVRWIAHSCRIVRGRDGAYLGRRASNRDITNQKLAEEEKAKLQDQFFQSQKMESVGRLAGGVAHDFNNMLGVILGHAEIAMDKVDKGQAFLTDLQEIQKAAKRSSDLTSRLLAFARKQTASPKVLDLNETIEGMLNMLQRLIGEDIYLAWLPGVNLWPVKIDPSQIDQILANLSVNARDAIAGVGKVTIETANISFDAAFCADHAGFVPGEYVMLAVSDDGCGMDKAILGKLFEPFFTTKETGKGTGLGLATIYGIVKQNNGFINLYSEPDQGTTFKIYLPKHIGTAEQIGTKEPLGTTLRGQETVLLVEDELSLLDLSKFMLERQGYRVLPAGTPGEAIRLAEEYAGEIHLLMTDVIMPEMNGQDLAKKMLSLYPSLKCLFTSGYTADVIAHHGVLDDGVYFLQKPFSKDALAAKVREALDQK